MRRGAGLIGAVALSVFSVSAFAEPPKDRDWGETLRTDAQALHDDIERNHPGPVNAEDPGFSAHNDAQLATALDRAKTAKRYPDYYFALKLYMSSFNDGHMGFWPTGDAPSDYQWPGFATRYDDNGVITVGVADPGAPVVVGERLISCDGMTADAYAAATLGQNWGSWMLEAQRLTQGWRQFVDYGNPYIPKASSCIFAKGKAKHTVTLNWQPLSADRLTELRNTLSARAKPDFAARTLPNGIRWFSMPSFDGHPDSPAGKALPGMIEGMKADQTALLSAPAIVLDLRGNGGGSSDWSAQIARILWTPEEVAAVPDEDDVFVDWRASPANLSHLAKFYDEMRYGEGFSDMADKWFRNVIGGMGPAIQRGDALWRETPFDETDKATEGKPDAAAVKAAVRKRTRPIYVLTDGSCGSACLDAVDFWTALGAIHIGRTTSADTLYMDIRERTLPSGLAGVAVPMKVYRGRPRGNNVPAVPAHKFTGNIADTAALEAWVATLPENGR